MSKQYILAAIACAVALPAFAGADCQKHPKSEWMPKEKLQQQLEAQGFSVKKIDTEDNCYELKGKDANGKRVENYYDTKTGKLVKSKSE